MKKDLIRSVILLIPGIIAWIWASHQRRLNKGMEERIDALASMHVRLSNGSMIPHMKTRR